MLKSDCTHLNSLVIGCTLLHKRLFQWRLVSVARQPRVILQALHKKTVGNICTYFMLKPSFNIMEFESLLERNGHWTTCNALFDITILTKQFWRIYVISARQQNNRKVVNVFFTSKLATRHYVSIKNFVRFLNKGSFYH